MGWFTATWRHVFGPPAEEPLPVAPLTAEAVLEIYRNWPDRRRAVHLARRAGFNVVGWGADTTDMDCLRQCGVIAAAAGISSADELSAALTGNFEDFLVRLFAVQNAMQPWGCPPEFVFELILIRSVYDRLTPDLLKRAGWHRSMARKPLLAAAADAATAETGTP